MGKASRDKGKRGEREARDVVRSMWRSPNCIRSAQVSGSFASDLMYGPEGLHLEVKRYARIAAVRWLEQAQNDSKGDVPVVLFKEDRGEWYIAMPIDRSEEFSRTLIKHLDGSGT